METSMKKISIMVIALLFCAGAFAYDDPLARAKSQLGYAEGLMDQVKTNPAYNATKDQYRQITEHLANAKQFLDRADPGDDPEENAKLTAWYEKLLDAWDAMKKKYFKDIQ
jgi:hypothetical protein